MECYQGASSGSSTWPRWFHRDFHQKAWQIIKQDIKAGIMKLYVGDGRGFSKLNKALITLIPKRSDAEVVGDYRPLSLTHSFAKLFAKALACRARRRMPDIVGANQSAFISGRCLHDNFLLVRQIARKIHARKIVGVFPELDITRASDSLGWPFLFQVLRHKGFSKRWIGWIAILLRTTSTKVVVNGCPGESFAHACGLRQGDPVLPLLFVIAMEVLSAMFRKGA